MRRCILVCLAVLLSTLGVTSSAHAAWGVNATLINDRIAPQPAAGGDSFFATTVDVYYSTGRVWLSQSADGSGPLMVDDAEDYTIYRPDGSTTSFTLDHQRSCMYLEDHPPLDITSLLQSGRNGIVVTYRDVCGGTEFADPHWVVNTEQPTLLYTQPALASVSASADGVSATKHLELFAKLVEANSGYPIGDEYVHFLAGGQEVCRALTRDDGVAWCDDANVIALATLSGGYTVRYDGNPWYLASRGRGELVSVRTPGE